MSVALQIQKSAAKRSALPSKPVAAPIPGHVGPHPQQSRRSAVNSVLGAHKAQRMPLGQVDTLPPPEPSWLVVLLLTLRRVSTPMMLLLLLGILPIYGWSVGTQQSWGKAFTRLQALRQNERQLLTRHEAQKYEITQTVEQNPTGFQPKGPHTTLFLKPEPARLPKAALKLPAPLPTTDVSPIGY